MRKRPNIATVIGGVVGRTRATWAPPEKNDSPSDGDAAAVPEEEMELRRRFGDRTFEAALKLLDKGAVVETVQLSPSAYYARVRDGGTKVVLFRERDGDFDATCDCARRNMGCKHCVAVYMGRIGFPRGPTNPTWRT